MNVPLAQEEDRKESQIKHKRTRATTKNVLLLLGSIKKEENNLKKNREFQINISAMAVDGQKSGD